MRNRVSISASILAVLVAGWACVAIANETSSIEIMSVAPIGENTCLAVEVPVAGGLTVTGLSWYNNDDQTVFPRVMAAAANAGTPPNLADALVIVDDVGGAEDDWSNLEFPQPIASPTDVLYVIFQFPVGTETDGRGVGPGIGYESSPAPSSVYLSDGEDDWLKMISAQKMLIEPVYSEASTNKSHRPVLVLPAPSVAEEAESEEELVRVTQLMLPYPNPFNPTVHFEFSLKETSRVRLSIYDVRGRRVTDLVNEELPRGRYEQTWQGRDESDRQVASGVYFARMTADGASWTHRMVLVK